MPRRLTGLGARRDFLHGRLDPLLDLLYAQAVGARRRWFERHPEARRRLRQPVISVGNLSVGGTGKTPLVSQIAQWLVERGERPAILSRGYGRRDRRDGVVVVSNGGVEGGPSSRRAIEGSRESREAPRWAVADRRPPVLADLDRAGDEPLMLARAVPRAIVSVADDRFLAGVLAERRLGATVHLLDDGFQHVQLARDFDLLLTTPGEIPGGRTLPFGRLRESLDAAARADFAVVVDADPAAAKAEAWMIGVSQASSARRRISKRAEGAGGPVVAVAGIAHPGQFFRMLTDAGYPVARAMAFPDHHRYSHGDIGRIRDAAEAAGTGVVVTTEKDAIRFEAAMSSVAPASVDVPFTFVAVPMTLEIDDWDGLCRCMTAAIQRATARERPRGDVVS